MQTRVGAAGINKDKPLGRETWTNGCILYKNFKIESLLVDAEDIKQVFPVVDNEYQETSSMMASSESAEQQPTADEGKKGLTVRQIAATANSETQNATNVNIISPQKQLDLPDSLEDNLGALGKRPRSPFSSSSSGRRRELGVKIVKTDFDGNFENVCRAERIQIWSTKSDTKAAFAFN